MYRAYISWVEVKIFIYFLFQRVHPSGCWIGCRFLGSGGRLRHRHRRRRRSPRYRPTAQIIRGNDFDPYFRRGVGSLRSHRCYLSLHKTVNLHYTAPVACASSFYASASARRVAHRELSPVAKIKYRIGPRSTLPSCIIVCWVLKRQSLYMATWHRPGAVLMLRPRRALSLVSVTNFFFLLQF